MNEFQRKVRDFHQAFGIPAPDKPSAITIERKRLRAALIFEEACELVEALGGQPLFCSELRDPDIHWDDPIDMVDAADALADLVYVVLGTAVELGVDIEPVFDEVHHTNMAKTGGPIRDDGKQLKPDDWEPPDIARHVALQEAETREVWAIEVWQRAAKTGERSVKRQYLARIDERRDITESRVLLEPEPILTFSLYATAEEYVRQYAPRVPGIQYVITPVVATMDGQFVRRGESRCDHW